MTRSAFLMPDVQQKSTSNRDAFFVSYDVETVSPSLQSHGLELVTQTQHCRPSGSGVAVRFPSGFGESVSL